jgi:uncharacterized membrane protein
VSDSALFLGRFHPLLVHFPIALLAVAALLQIVAFARPGRRSDPIPASMGFAIGLLLWLGALGAVLSAVAGLLLGSSGAYGGEVFTRHQWLGLILAGLSIAAALVWSIGEAGRRWPALQFTLVVSCGLLLVAVGHLGASLTHGEGYLVEHAPAFLRGWLGSDARGPLTSRSPAEIVVFDHLIQPALHTHCASCHGPAKVEGGLRLDSFESLVRGGDDGPVIVIGQAASSDLVRRVFLPPSHEDAMPPAGHRPLSPADAALLRWWVDQGASATARLADLEVSENVAPVVEALVGPAGAGGPSVPSAAVAPAPASALAAVQSAGFTVEPVADGLHVLNVHATNALDRVDDAAVRALERVSAQVLWLDLANTRVTDAAVDTIARMPHLTRLRLQNTAVTDAGLARLSGLSHLESLNVFGTSVTDAALESLASMKSLRTVYLWDTGVTTEGVSRLKAARPTLVVETGGYVSNAR